jgi:hypothetical protein
MPSIRLPTRRFAAVRNEFDLSQERADELIHIAEGRTTVEKVREGGRQRRHKHQATKKAKKKPVLARDEAEIRNA